MKRAIIFAHYDRDNIIDKYVIEYLLRLRKITDDIIFISDCNLSEDEKSKIFTICLDIIAVKHGEYDFGSYKRGFNLLKNKHKEKFSKIDELIFANDSCFSICDFNDVFSKMEKELEIDVWGLTDNHECSYHLQSYFLVFRKSVFLEEFFINHLNLVEIIPDKHELVLRYEVGLSEILKSYNKKFFALFGAEEVNNYIVQNQECLKREIIEVVGCYKRVINHDFLYKIISTLNFSYCRSDLFFVLVKMGCPILKNRFSNKKIIPLFGEKILKRYANYNVGLINQYCNRIRGRSLMPQCEFTKIKLISFFLIRDFFKKILGWKRYKI